MTSRNYCLISPVRDEEEFVERTLISVISQTVKPKKWVIVDDGSQDTTGDILARYAQEHQFITVITLPRSGERRVGPGVIAAFYRGYQEIDSSSFDFICKLDMDLDLPENYFEILMSRMNANLRIGTCSGKAYFPARSNTLKNFDGELINEGIGDEMSVGMTKFYRSQCFEEIGGFVREVMWDGIDCHRCRMLGWIACSWDDPELRFIHLRPMGSSHKGIITGRLRHGRGQWFMGTSLSFMVASAVYRMAKRPYIIGGVSMLAGYLAAMLRRAPRYEDCEFRLFLRNYQKQSLLKGKMAAIQNIDLQQESIWRTNHPCMLNKR